MISNIFNEIKKEARNSEIILKEDNIEFPVRIGFNVVDNTISNSLPNFYINDKDKFYKILSEYAYVALDFYDLDKNYDNLKNVLTFLWANITNLEMNSLEDYVYKYYNFICDNSLVNKNGLKNTSIGKLNYEISKQSNRQETPYCFKSYFQNGNSMYALPRVSFGISDGVCYIYSIQNKDSKINNDYNYNLEVKNKMRTINSGIKKYRNLTPSFIVVLALFISYLKENHILNVKVETPLPIRRHNRDLVTNYKIQFETKRGVLKDETLEVFKKEVISKNINDDYNSTIKFVNCFNRLKVHFDNMYLSNNEIDDNIFLEITDLTTANNFLQEIVNSNNIEKERYNGKIS